MLLPVARISYKTEFISHLSFFYLRSSTNRQLFKFSCCIKTVAIISIPQVFLDFRYLYNIKLNVFTVVTGGAVKNC